MTHQCLTINDNKIIDFHHTNLTRPTTLPANDTSGWDNMFRFQIAKTPVADLFFSNRNIEVLHNEILRQVQLYSQRTIDRQSDYELLMVMRSVYLQYSMNNNKDVVPQVKELNEMVLAYCVPNIISNLVHHVHYLQEVGVNPVPHDRAKYMSLTGTKFTGAFF